MSGAPKEQPLAGRKVVVTRAADQAAGMIEELERLGATVLLLPAVSFAEPDDWGALDTALNEIVKFNWVLLTSQNAVRFLCQRAKALGMSLQGPRYAAVGPATARAAEQEGLKISHVATKAQGNALVTGLETEVSGKRVLLPRSNRARPDLPATLRRAGAEVVEVVAYRTTAGASQNAVEYERVRTGEMDMLTFASPSAFHHLLEQFGEDEFRLMAKGVAMAAIGPVTASAIREAGFAVAVEAVESSGAGLVAAIAGYFAEMSSTGVRKP